VSFVPVTKIGESAESVVEIKEWDWRVQPTVVDSSSARRTISMSERIRVNNVQDAVRQRHDCSRATRRAPRSDVVVLDSGVVGRWLGVGCMN
jgi:hypothetical protein